MSEIILNKGDFELMQYLSIEEIVFLKILYNKDQGLYDIFYKYTALNLRAFIQNLESGLYIKVLDGDYSQIESFTLRTKADSLFKEETEPVIEVINYFNDKLRSELNKSKGVSVKSSANRRVVSGRLSEGYTVQDIKDVIDYKIREWKGTQWEPYIRLETLCGATKFQGYFLNSQKRKPVSFTKDV